MSDPADDRTRRLLKFLREHDADCPLCGYNLRGLTEPRCPECRHELVLGVGVRKVHVVWLTITLAPCFFSGIAAVLLLMPIVWEGGAPPVILVTDAFGFVSGAGAVVLVIHRRRFMGLKLARQMLWAGIVWAVHFAAFLMLVVAALI